MCVEGGFGNMELSKEDQAKLFSRNQELDSENRQLREQLANIKASLNRQIDDQTALVYDGKDLILIKAVPGRIIYKNLLA